MASKRKLRAEIDRKHTLVPCAYTNAKPRWEWFGCSCGATWTAPKDKPGRCPREEEGKR